jgi:hypothetical protein
MEPDTQRRNLKQFVALTDFDLIYLSGSHVTGDVGSIHDSDFGARIRQDTDRLQVTARFPPPSPNV